MATEINVTELRHGMQIVERNKKVTVVTSLTPCHFRPGKFVHINKGDCYDLSGKVAIK